MLLYSIPYQYKQEDFFENKKFSCHSWINKCIEDISNSHLIVEKNSNYLNELDLVGKFNSLNYLLDVFSYHQNSKLMNYPKEQNPYLDFLLIFNELLMNGADIFSYDYKRNSFLDNLNEIVFHDKNNKWRGKPFNFTEEMILFVYQTEVEKTEVILKQFGNIKNDLYLPTILNLQLKKNDRVNLPFKI